MYGAPFQTVTAPQPPELTPAALSNWSISQRQPLPEREAIRAIHVYDFDNTLFLSPLPNPKIWHAQTLNSLQAPQWLANGGWWHDSRVLAATGEGLEKEEERGWKGWWNENIVKLVQLSMEQKDALTVLLTGRSTKGFAPLIQRIVGSRGLEFDMIVLKPETYLTPGPNAKNTIGYKCAFLEEMLNTYTCVEELKIYEDRVKHVRGLEEFAQSYIANTMGRRAPLRAEVVQVAEESRTLYPSVELREAQTMIDEHNAQRRGLPHLPHLRIKKTVFYTGYLLSSKATASVLNALEIPKLVAQEQDVKLLANNVMITPRPASRSILQRTGDLGREVEFEVAGVGNWDNRVWAALVKPVDENIRIYTDNPQPIIVLAVRRSAKPIDAGRIKEFSPPPRPGIRFQTVVGEKLLLRIEEEMQNEGEWESLFPPKRRGHNGPATDDVHMPTMVWRTGW